MRPVFARVFEFDLFSPLSEFNQYGFGSLATDAPEEMFCGRKTSGKTTLYTDNPGVDDPLPANPTIRHVERGNFNEKYVVNIKWGKKKTTRVNGKINILQAGTHHKTIITRAVIRVEHVHGVRKCFVYLRRRLDTIMTGGRMKLYDASALQRRTTRTGRDRTTEWTDAAASPAAGRSLTLAPSPRYGSFFLLLGSFQRRRLVRYSRRRRAAVNNNIPVVRRRKTPLQYVITLLLQYTFSYHRTRRKKKSPARVFFLYFLYTIILHLLLFVFIRFLTFDLLRTAWRSATTTMRRRRSFVYTHTHTEYNSSRTVARTVASADTAAAAAFV